MNKAYCLISNCIAFFLTLNTLNSQTKSPFPGFAFAHLSADTIFTQQYEGYADLNNRVPYTNCTTQAIGSVSKTVIGIALMKAVEEGYFKLDDDINTLLPFHATNPHHPQATITIRHLATHTSGIRDRKLTYYLKTYQKGDTTTLTLEQFLKSYFTPGSKFYSRFNFNKNAPGSTYDYSNIAAALAAYIIEYNTHMSYAVFTTRHIFHPLNMMNTFWFYSDSHQKRAILYNKHNKPIKPYALITYPDGGLKTTLPDLSLYLQTIIKGYQGHSIILKSESWKQIFTPQFDPIHLPLNMNISESNQGLFFTFTNKHLIGHTGSDPGVCAMMFFDYQTGVGRIFMANKEISKCNKTEFQKIWKNTEGN